MMLDLRARAGPNDKFMINPLMRLCPGLELCAAISEGKQYS